MSDSELVCPLCSKVVTELHPRSHIIPAFINRELGDEKGRSIHLGGNGSRKTTQSGDFGSIVCNPCEVSFNPYDRFLAHCFKDKLIKFQIKRMNFRDGFCEKWSGLDFEKLYGFCISIVIRAELLSRQKAAGNILSPKHYDAISRMFRDENFDGDQYPIIIRKLIGDGNVSNLTYYPNRGRIAGHNVVVWAFLGFEFRIFTTSHAIPKEFLQIKLNRDGECIVLEEEVSSALSLKKIMKQHLIEREIFQKKKQVSPSAR